MKSKPKSKKIGIATTLAAAATITGLSATTIQACKAAGCRAFQANGRIDCDALIEFAATLPDTGDAPDYALERAKKMRADRMLKEQQFKERDKMLWPIEKVRLGWARNVIACKTKMITAENSVSVEAGMRLNLTNQQMTTIKEIHIQHNRAALKELFNGEWGKVECPACKKEIV
jgi:hypothetical protein